ncbi:MAG: YggS family pyridoxal phosphate-dependent enzyme [Rhodospirillaceae bacterium]|nr:YggS family pyridoxal phosphate-dependent enzyme [Rhodospirillaceae bacterium]
MTDMVDHRGPVSLEAEIAGNLGMIAEKIVGATISVGRDPNAVSLVAVSKVQPIERVAAALAAGHRLFGENRVQEAQAKWPTLRERYPDLTLHLIGPLQTNKVRDAVALFDVIETVDRPKLAKALREEMDRQGLNRTCFVQVNTGEEPQKAGVPPNEVDAFVAFCRDEVGLDVAGLMCIPPIDDGPALHFALLREIARRVDVEELSMGMSGDFVTAIELGATLVRIGTAVFGTRDRSSQ